jgi:hypothetical protein
MFFEVIVGGNAAFAFSPLALFICEESVSIDIAIYFELLLKISQRYCCGIFLKKMLIF